MRYSCGDRKVSVISTRFHRNFYEGPDYLPCEKNPPPEEAEEEIRAERQQLMATPESGNDPTERRFSANFGK